MSPEELKLLRGQYPTLEVLERHNVPVTRENYIAYNWQGAEPDQSEGEFETLLPPPLRRKNDEPPVDIQARKTGPDTNVDIRPKS